MSEVLNLIQKQPELQARIVSLTPAMAKEMLASISQIPKGTHEVEQRAVNLDAINRYALQIKSGQWALNGEPIIISSDGYLLDGQHRCHAVIKAEIPIDVMIVEGVAHSAITTIDQNRVRSHTDVLNMSGYAKSLASIMAPVARMEMRMLETGTILDMSHNSNKKFIVKETPQDVLAFVDGNEALRAACEWAASFRGKKNQLYARSSIAWMKYRFTKIDADFTEVWLDDFMSGANLSIDDSRLWIRSRIAREATSLRKTREIYRMCWLIKGFTGDRTGKPYRSESGLFGVSSVANTLKMVEFK